MSEFVKIAPESIGKSPFELIGKDWTLITAGDAAHFNTMTASWGSLGVIWRKPAAFVFVRHSRYTFEFMEKQQGFTLSFFDEGYRAALNLCGTKSGRECDKVKEAGLTPRIFGDLPAFEEAKLVLTCRTMFHQDMPKEAFVDQGIYADCYPTDDIHRRYVGEITGVYQKK